MEEQALTCGRISCLGICFWPLPYICCRQKIVGTGEGFFNLLTKKNNNKEAEYRENIY